MKKIWIHGWVGCHPPNPRIRKPLILERIHGSPPMGCRRPQAGLRPAGRPKAGGRPAGDRAEKVQVNYGWGIRSGGCVTSLLGSAPFCCVPFCRVPFRPILFRSVPFRSVPFRSVPSRPVPYRPPIPPRPSRSSSPRPSTSVHVRPRPSASVQSRPS